MYKYSNQLLPDVFDNRLSKPADFHGYDTRNASTQNVYVRFRGKTRVQKTLSYCGALIWNYILDNVDSNCAIGSYKKRIQRLFLFSNDDLITWYNNTQCLEASMEIILSLCIVYTYVCHMRYICGYTCAWKKCFILEELQPSALFLFCTPNTICLVSLISGHISHDGFKPPLTGFIYLMYISFTTSVLYSSPLYMNCMSLGNKDYFIVIIIAMWQ